MNKAIVDLDFVTEEGIQLGEGESPSPFIQKYNLLDSILSEMSNDISKMMEDLVMEPVVENGMEMFPEGTASLTIESSLYSYNLIKASRELKQCLIGSYRALEQLQEIKNDSL